jgi:hypothetical protein
VPSDRSSGVAHLLPPPRLLPPQTFSPDLSSTVAVLQVHSALSSATSTHFGCTQDLWAIFCTISTPTSAPLTQALGRWCSWPGLPRRSQTPSLTKLSPWPQGSWRPLERLHRHETWMATADSSPLRSSSTKMSAGLFCSLSLYLSVFILPHFTLADSHMGSSRRSRLSLAVCLSSLLKHSGGQAYSYSAPENSSKLPLSRSRVLPTMTRLSPLRIAQKEPPEKIFRATLPILRIQRLLCRYPSHRPLVSLRTNPPTESSTVHSQSPLLLLCL